MNASRYRSVKTSTAEEVSDGESPSSTRDVLVLLQIHLHHEHIVDHERLGSLSAR